MRAGQRGHGSTGGETCLAVEHVDVRRAVAAVRDALPAANVSGVRARRGREAYVLSM